LVRFDSIRFECPRTDATMIHKSNNVQTLQLN
jgi:hypothetical protein